MSDTSTKPDTRWSEDVKAGDRVMLIWTGGTILNPKITYTLTTVKSAARKQIRLEARSDLVFERATGRSVSRHDRAYHVVAVTPEVMERYNVQKADAQRRHEERVKEEQEARRSRQRKAIRASQVLSELTPPRMVEVLSEQTLCDAYYELVRRGEITKKEVEADGDG